MSTAQKRAENEIKYIRNTMEYRRLRINKSNPLRLAELNKRIAKLQTIVNAVPVRTSKKLPLAINVKKTIPTPETVIPKKIIPKPEMKKVIPKKVIPKKVTPKQVIPKKVTPKPEMKKVTPKPEMKKVTPKPEMKKVTPKKVTPKKVTQRSSEISLTESVFLEQSGIDNIHGYVDSDESVVTDDVDFLSDLEDNLPDGNDRERTLSELEAELDDFDDLE